MLTAPYSKVSAKIATLTIIASLGFFASACGSADKDSAPEVTPTPVASTSSATPSSTQSSTSASVELPEPGTIPAEQVPAPQRPAVRAELTPIACQSGLGPIVTTWSDGSIGGWSQMCQDVKDQAVAAERQANTPVCDGTVCTYPNGATLPDPNAPVQPLPTQQPEVTTSVPESTQETTVPELELESEEEPTS